jgi:hypothetical protein
LVRNDPQYRGFFPAVDDWDLPGLGGWITILTECGILGFVLFLAVFIAAYRGSEKHEKNLVLLSALPFAFGVQMYFSYPWIILGLAKQSTARIRES